MATRSEKLAAKVGEARARVVERVLAMMERDGLEWAREWSAASCAPYNAETGRRYAGGNRLYLMGLYDDPRWMTFNQARGQGYFPRKGERSEIVEYWKPMRMYRDADGNLVALRKGQRAPEGAEVVERTALAGVFHVFNAGQLADREGNPYPPLEPEGPASALDEGLCAVADRLEASSRCPVREGTSNRAFYSPAADAITMPARGRFRSMESFIGTLTHEMAHSTAGELGRDAGGAFGSEGYAREELVAELASLFCCLDLGVERDGDLESDGNAANHAAYLKSWMAALRDDPGCLFRAAAEADRARAAIMGRYDREARATA